MDGWIDNGWIGNGWIGNGWIDNGWIDNGCKNGWIGNGWIDLCFLSLLDFVESQKKLYIYPWVCPIS